jgi:hypothetical protein
MAFAHAHLQKFERRKLNCINKKDPNNISTMINGDTAVGDWRPAQTKHDTIPFAIDLPR